MASRISVRLVLSYILDWIVIIATAAVGGAISNITPNKRPFDLADPDISFPFVSKEKISSALLVAISLVAPAVIIFIVTVFIGIGPTREKTSLRSSLKRKLWEWNAGWLGLALSLAIAFFITNGTKNLVGRPRPDLLARCDPDLSQLLNSTVGGITGPVDEGINLVSSTICRTTGSKLDDGFRSFPSGHSSSSFAGLTYLALFLSTKLGGALPFLNYPIQPSHSSQPLRTQAAAPPTYLLIFPLTPICAAIYVASTRYSDFFHHGFDIISGASLGIASAWLGFYWYQLPIRRGGGWAWAPRSPEHAFTRGIGVLSYASEENTELGRRDLESRVGLVSETTTRMHHPGSSESTRGLELNDFAAGANYGGGGVSESSRMPLR